MIEMEIENRQAKHNYFIDDTYECGIVLKGTEIKSIRAGKCNLRDSYGIIKANEIFVLNMFISPYIMKVKPVQENCYYIKKKSKKLLRM